MKIRLDFVSNSSSSSFMLVGESFSHDELFDAWKKLHPENDEDEFDPDDYAYEVADECNLHCQRGIYDYIDEYVIGLPFSKMNDDETKKQFIDRINDALRKFFPNPNADECVDGGYDG